MLLSDCAQSSNSGPRHNGSSIIINIIIINIITRISSSNYCEIFQHTVEQKCDNPGKTHDLILNAEVPTEISSVATVRPYNDAVSNDRFPHLFHNNAS
jgi:hypothetical protein